MPSLRETFSHSWKGADEQRTAVTWERFLGIDLADDNSNLPDGVVPYAMNVDFGQLVGAASKSYGMSSVLANLGNTGAGRVYGLFVTTIDNLQYLIAAVDGKLYAAQGGQQTFEVDTVSGWGTGTLTDATITSDGKLTVTSGQSSCTWVSPAYYLGALVYTTAVEWYSNVPSGCTVSCSYSVSSDGTTWSAYYTQADPGELLYAASYVKIRFVLTGTAANLFVARFALITSGEFGNPQVIYSSLAYQPIRFATYMNALYFCDGGRPYIWNGTTVRVVGVDPPTAAPTLAAASGGSLTGTYYGVYTYVNADGVESNPSPASASVAPSSQIITWTVPVGPSGTASRKLYRTEAGALVYYYVATISDNTTTSYSDTTADTSLVTEMDDDNNVPPEATILLVYNDQMFYVSSSNPTQLWFSKPGAPEQVPNISEEQFYKQFTGQIRMVIGSMSGVLAVSGAGFTAVVTGTEYSSDPSVDNTTIYYVGNMGALSQEAAAVCYVNKVPVSLALVTESMDLYLMYPTYLREDAYATTPLSRDIDAAFKAINRPDSVVVGFSNQRILVGANVNNSDIVPATDYGNNALMTYDMRLNRWQGVMSLDAAAIFPTPLGWYIGSSAGGEISRVTTIEDIFYWGSRWGGYWGSVPYCYIGAGGAPLPIQYILDTGYKRIPGGELARPKFLQLVISGASITDELSVIIIADGMTQTIPVGSLSTWGLPANYSLGYGIGRQDTVTSPKFPINLPPARYVAVRLTELSMNPLIVYGISIECLPVAPFTERTIGW